MSEYGIIVAADNSDLSRPGRKVDSRKPRWSVDLEANPPHMNIITTAGGLTAFNDSPSTPGNLSQQETLLSVKHHLDFTPLCLVYFYVLSYNGNSVAVPAKDYASGAYIMSGSVGTLNDDISYEADTSEFRIVHRMDTYGFGTNYNSTAPNFQIQVKYYIMPIDMQTSIYRYMGPLLP